MKFEIPPGETLRKKQWRFVRMLNKLVDYVETLPGYELTAGDAYRDPRLHGEIGVKKGYGHAKSGHKNRLAQDYNLYINDVWMQESEAFATLGAFWVTLADDARWGGEFGDGNHFSLEHAGVK